MIVKKNIFPLEWNLKDKLKVPYHGKKVFGTFVCGGGSSMGYKLAGFDHVGGVEFTDHYSRVYKVNHKPRHFYLQDIREFNKRTDLPKELYTLDLLDGSPPCAAFSTAGALDKLWGKKSSYENKKQRKDDLVFVYCETIKKLMPKVCLLENVSGLIKGNSKAYAKKIKNTIEGLGYNVQLFAINAASMGIPQLRPRVFFIGLKKEYKLPRLELNFNCPTVNFEVTKKYWDHHTNNEFCIKKYSTYKLWDDVEIGKNHKKNFSLSKPHPKKPSPTILESQSARGTYSAVHPYQKRQLNAEEVRLLSTFPLDYNFLDVNSISVMGRSVLPVMMANISNQIYKQWLSKL